MQVQKNQSRARIDRPRSYNTAHLLFDSRICGVLALWKHVAALLLLITAVAGNDLTANAQSLTDAPTKLDGRVYVFRGDMGTFFSTGMDYLAAELNQHGLTAGTYNWPDLGCAR